MDIELLRELGLGDLTSLQTIEYVQKCIDIYEQTLRAMGLTIPETIGQTVDGSQLSFVEHVEVGRDVVFELAEAWALE